MGQGNRNHSNDGYSVDPTNDYGRVNSMETTRPRRATLESQPLHVGFDIDDKPPQAIGAAFGHHPQAPQSDYHQRDGRDHSAYEPQDNRSSLGSRFSEAFEEIVGKPEQQAGLDEALIRMKKKAYVKDASITGLFVLSWYFFATLLSVYNKWMFAPEYYNFPYPLFVTMCHQIIQFGLAVLVRRIWPALKPKERPNKDNYVKKVIPAAVSTGLDIGLSNLSLKTVTLTLYTMCKSSTLIFVLMFAFIFHLEAYSVRLILVISCISVGVFLMVFNATTVSIPGIVMIFSASAMAGLRWALTQLAMHKKEMGMTNPFATIYWLAPVMAVTLGMVSLPVEGWIGMFSGSFFEGFKAIQTCGFILLPGGVAFAMVASEYYIIQRAGIVPLSIAGIFKEVTTIAISSWIFGDELTRLNEVGVVVTLCGIATYSYHKYQKTIHGDANDHGVSDGRPGEGDGFAPLPGVEEGDIRMTGRGSREDRDMYVLGEEDEDDDGQRRPHDQVYTGSTR